MRTNQRIEIVCNLIRRREIPVILSSQNSILDDDEDIATLCQALLVWSDIIFHDLDSHVMESLTNVGSLNRYFADVLNAKEFKVFPFFSSLKIIEDNLKRVFNTINDLSQIPGPDYFKRSLVRQGCNVHLANWVAPAFSLISIREPKYFFIIVQSVAFLSRLQARTVDFSEENVKKYMSFEELLHDTDAQYCLDPNSRSHSILSLLHVIVQEWFQGWKGDDITCHHGPGSIAGLSRVDSSLRTKYKVMLPTPILKNIDEWLYDIALLPMRYYTDDCAVFHGMQFSEVVFVPKTFLKNRIISRENCDIMFWQQGLKESLVRYFKRRRHSSFHWLNLEDQTLSQQLAYEGSLDGTYATIDLSDASDSVTLRQVDELFAEMPIRYLLRSFRTPITRLDGNMIELEKYAPMGSALCFPIECIVFGSICELAVRTISHRKSRPGDFRVYGDDIVVKQRYVPYILDILETLNFRVNTSKSFFDVLVRNFREACGREYLDGRDVTPVRISRKFSVPRSASASTIVNYIDFCNRLFEQGYFTARRRVMSILNSYIDIHSLRFSSDNSQIEPLCLVTGPDSCTNYSLKKRKIVLDRGRGYNPQYASYRYKALVQKVFHCDEDVTDIGYYHHCVLKRCTCVSELDHPPTNGRLSSIVSEDGTCSLMRPRIGISYIWGYATNS